MLAASDAERRALERELHDGVHEDLIALSLRLQVVQSLARDDTDHALQLLEEMTADVRDALVRLRTLAERMYPAVLDPLGVADALREGGIEVDGGDIGRDDPAAEASLYFLCRDLGVPRLRLWRDGGDVVVEADASTVSTRVRDRVEAVGGSLRQRGGAVSITIPAARRPPV